MIVRVTAALAAATACLPAAATAQRAVSAGVEATNDEVRRGISWSGGRASASADALLTLGSIEASARVAALRGSSRHGDADAAIDLAVGSGWDLGAIRIRATATGHLFTGAATRMDYVELGGSAGFGLGPAQLTGGAIYAPSQAAIGGDNVYLYAGLDSGVPGTPFSVVAEIGRSSGSVDDPVRAQRLRPGGSYTDWRIGVEHRSGPLTLGLSYIGTDIDRDAAIGPFADARHAGDKIVGRVRVGL